MQSTAISTLLDAFNGASDSEALDAARDFLRRDNNPLTNYVYREITQKIANDAERRKKLESHYLPYNITPTELNQICLEYPEFNVELNKRPIRNGHGFAANTRGLEIRTNMFKVGNYKCIGIGEDPTWYIRNGYRNVHCCFKLCDIRCKVRAMSHHVNIAKMATFDEKKIGVVTAAKDALNNPGKYYCYDDTIHCTKQADYAVANHSLYDFSIIDIMNAMISHGTKFLFASVIFNYQILYDYNNVEEGYLPLNKAHYCWTKRGDITYIDFSFRNDSSLGYSHRWDTYYQLFTTNARFHRGYTFVFEMQENRLDTQFLKITKVSAPHPGRDYYFHRIWHPEAAEKVMVKVFSYKYTRGPVPSNSLVIKWIPCYRSLYEQTLGWCLNWTTNNLTLENVFGILAHRSASFLANGSVITRAYGEDVDPHNLAQLSVSLFWEASLIKYNNENAIKVLNAAENIKRWVYTSAWYRVLWGSLSELATWALWAPALHHLFGVNIGRYSDQHNYADKPTFGELSNKPRPSSPQITYSTFRSFMATIHRVEDFSPEVLALPAYLTFGEYVRYYYCEEDPYIKTLPDEAPSPVPDEKIPELTHDERNMEFYNANMKLENRTPQPITTKKGAELNKNFPEDYLNSAIDHFLSIDDVFPKTHLFDITEYRRIGANYCSNNRYHYTFTWFQNLDDYPYDNQTGKDICRNFYQCQSRVQVAAALQTFLKVTGLQYSQSMTTTLERLSPLPPDNIVDTMKIIYQYPFQHRTYDLAQKMSFLKSCHEYIQPYFHHNPDPAGSLIPSLISLALDTNCCLGLTGPAFLDYLGFVRMDGPITVIRYSLNTIIHYYNHYCKYCVINVDSFNTDVYAYLREIIMSSRPINTYDFPESLTEVTEILDAYIESVSVHSDPPTPSQTPDFTPDNSEASSVADSDDDSSSSTSNDSTNSSTPSSTVPDTVSTIMKVPQSDIEDRLMFSAISYSSRQFTSFRLSMERNRLSDDLAAIDDLVQAHDYYLSLKNRFDDEHTSFSDRNVAAFKTVVEQYENSVIVPDHVPIKLLIHAFPASGKSTWLENVKFSKFDTDFLKDCNVHNVSSWPAYAFEADVVVTNYHSEEVLSKYYSKGYVSCTVHIDDTVWSTRFQSRLSAGTLDSNLPWQSWRDELSYDYLSARFTYILADFPDSDLLSGIIDDVYRLSATRDPTYLDPRLSIDQFRLNRDYFSHNQFVDSVPLIPEITVTPVASPVVTDDSIGSRLLTDTNLFDEIDNVAPAILPDTDVTVIGISGPTRSGKSTLAQSLSTLLCAKIIHQDDFLNPIITHGYKNYDTDDAIDWPEFFSTVSKAINEAAKVTHSKYLIVEGFRIYSKSIGLSLFDCKIFLELDASTAYSRRATTKPILQSHFNKYVWPAHQQYIDVCSRLPDLYVISATATTELIHDLAVGCITGGCSYSRPQPQPFIASAKPKTSPPDKLHDDKSHTSMSVDNTLKPEDKSAQDKTPCSTDVKPKIKPDRSINIVDYSGLPYVADYPYKVIKNGQAKLLISLAHFIHKYCIDNLIYFGCTPGLNILALLEAMPNLRITGYDPRPLPWKHDRMNFIQGSYPTVRFDNCHGIYSDVRAVNKKDPDFKTLVKNELLLQKEFIRLNRHVPIAIKFRLPYPDETDSFDFFAGDIYVQPYTTPGSTECRLYIPAGPLIKSAYDTKLYESRCHEYNTVARTNSDRVIADKLLSDAGCQFVSSLLDKILNGKNSVVVDGDQLYNGLWHFDTDVTTENYRIPIAPHVDNPNIEEYRKDGVPAAFPMMQVVSDLYNITVVLYHNQLKNFMAFGSYPTFIVVYLDDGHYQAVVPNSFQADHHCPIGEVYNVTGDGNCFYRACCVSLGTLESHWKQFKTSLFSNKKYDYKLATATLKPDFKCVSFHDQNLVDDDYITDVSRKFGYECTRDALALIAPLRPLTKPERTLLVDDIKESMSPTVVNICGYRRGLDVVSSVVGKTMLSTTTPTIYNRFHKRDRDFAFLQEWLNTAANVKAYYNRVIISVKPSSSAQQLKGILALVAHSLKAGGDAFILYQCNFPDDYMLINNLSFLFASVQYINSPFHDKLSSNVWIHCMSRNHKAYNGNVAGDCSRLIHDVRGTYWASQELLVTQLLHFGRPKSWLPVDEKPIDNAAGTPVKRMTTERNRSVKYTGTHPAERKIVMAEDLKATAIPRRAEFIEYLKYDFAQTVADMSKLVDGFGPTNARTWPNKYNWDKAVDQTQMCVFQRDEVTGYYQVKKNLANNQPTSEYAFLYDRDNGLLKCKYKTKAQAYQVDGTTAHYLYANRHLKLIQSEKLLEKFDHYTPNHDARMFLMEGPPGCGKTYQALELAKRGHAPTAILTATKKGAEDVESRLGDRAGTIFVKTIDSYVLNFSHLRFERIFIDEALMVHSAVYDYIATVSQCRYLYLFGDRNQIPFISRVQNYKLSFAQYDFKPHQVNFQPISMRCPQDVISLIRDKYPGKIQTTNPIIESMTIQEIDGLVDQHIKITDKLLSYEPGRQYIAYYQAEKHALIKAGFLNALTVGEAQGQTHKHVTMVRLDTKSQPFFSSTDEHYLVAISRHTHSFIYATCNPTATNDAILSSIKKKQLVNDLMVDNLVASEKMKTFLSAVEKLTLGAGDLTPPPIADPNRDVACLQYFYDSVFPGIRTTEDNMGLDYQLEHNPLHVTLPGLKIDASKTSRGVKPYRFGNIQMLCKVQTAQPTNRPITQKQTVIAIQKRNADAPKNIGPRQLCEFEDRIWPRFKKAYCVHDVEDKIANFKANPVRPDKQLIAEVVAEMKETKISTLENPRYRNRYPNDNAVSLYDLIEYEVMIKRDPKNVLEDTKAYQALQVIAASSAKVNALFGGVFRELYRRFRTILRPNVYCHLKKNLNQMEQALNDFLDPLIKYFILEIDQSKYDKSQQEFVFEVERKFWCKFGLDENWANLWFTGHSNTKLVSIVLGIFFPVWFQRKSGDVTTCFGNTIINMAAIADTIDLDLAVLLMFVGDDSIIYMTEEIDTKSIANSILIGWNFTIKLIRHKGAYFCSTFQVYDGNRYRVLPDPLKRTERISKPIEKSQMAFVYENFISFADLVKCYNNSAAVEALCTHFALRYGNSIGLVDACASLYHISKSFDRYSDLYYDITKRDPGAAWVTDRTKFASVINHKCLVIEASSGFFSRASKLSDVKRHFDSSSERPFHYIVKPGSLVLPNITNYHTYINLDSFSDNYKSLGFKNYAECLQYIHTSLPFAKLIRGQVNFRY